MRGAAQKLAEDTESYILGVIREGAGTKASGAIPAGGVYELLIQIKAALDGKNVPRTGRKLIVPVSVEGQLLLDNRFITGNGALSDARLTEGCIARAAGFDIYVSNDLDDEIVAMTADGVTFANQITKIEAYRREKGFDDGVKGLSLCGAKVVIPDCVYIHTISE